MGLEWVPLVATTGWASGLNGYLVVLLLGLGGRYLSVDGIPASMTDGRVLVAAAVLTLAHVVADKVPYVDSVWDAVHTFIRPVIGGSLGVLLAGPAESLESVGAAGVGGGLALAAHAVKATTRLAVNTSPETFSNVLVSSAEDLAVSGVVALAMTWPWVAAGIALTLLAVGATIAFLLWRATRRFAGRARDRITAVRERRPAPLPGAGAPHAR